MRHVIRKVAVFMLATSLSLNVIQISVLANTFDSGVMRAWPGRPGGNGDGSEEWLQGKYGQPNGPFKVLCKNQGLVSDLNEQQRIANTVGRSVVAALLAEVLKGTPPLVTKGVVNATMIAKSWSGKYKGVYYKSVTYISGRCMKTVITTYENQNYTKQVATYTKWTKW